MYRIILGLFASLMFSCAYGICTKAAFDIYLTSSNSLLPKTMNYNKYDSGDYVGGVGGFQMLNQADYSYAAIYSCTNDRRILKARMTLSTPVSVPTGQNAYQLPNNPNLAVAVRVADTGGALANISTIPYNVINYAGPTNGIKIEVTTYLKKGYSSQDFITITSQPIAELYLTDTSGNDLNVARFTIYYTVSSGNITLVEYTCSLRSSTYSVALENVSMRYLPAVGQDSTLTPKNLDLTIDCPYLQDGKNREIKAYITDGLYPINSTSILRNKEGVGFATGVGVRLRNTVGNIINLDPNESKALNKWTFSNIGTSQVISHQLKVNYARTANQVTAGNVEAKALLNIVYD